VCSPGINFIPCEIRKFRFRGVTLETDSYVTDILRFEGSATAETVYIACYDLSHTGSGNFEIGILSDVRFLWRRFRGGRDETSGFIFPSST
jgi:hypothetical protein